MEKVKYDSLYKFIVSIGMLIIISPFVFMYNVLSKNDIINISENQINEMTNTSQEIIKMEQQYKYIILKNMNIYIYISMFIIFIGLIIIIYGIIKWKNNVQELEDKSRKLSSQLLEKKIEALTVEEKELKMIKDVKIQTETSTSAEVEISEEMEKNIELFEKFQNVKVLVYKSIQKKFKNYDIYEDVKVEDQIYDCIAISRSDADSCDYIFEIKYFENFESLKNLVDIYERCATNEKQKYFKNNHRKIELILIFIINNFNKADQLANKKTINEIKGNISCQTIITGDQEVDSEIDDLQLKKTVKF